MTPDRRAVLTASLAAAAAVPAMAASAALPAVEQQTVASPVHPAQPVAETTSGRVRGFAQGGVRVFRGIPYGAPIDGDNRFQPPRPPQSWSGVRDTITYGDECPFHPSSILPVPVHLGPEDGFLLYRAWMPQIAGEDCLRLNVWAPSRPGKRPVMVFMHGGGYVAGSGHGLVAYDGANLADRGDVVVVTHNHRLNIFGYLDLSRFGGRWSQSVNLGMQDVVAVLRWIRDNIAAFGGDPDNVTVFGQSGGGGKVLTLMAMPAAKGLFHKAIVESGTFPGFTFTTSAAAQETTQRMLSFLGLTDATLDKLRDVPVDRLCDAANSVSQPTWCPVVDGTILPVAPGHDGALSPGLPLMIGTNLNELFNAVDNPLAIGFDEAALDAATAKKYGARGPAIAAAYRRSLPERAPFELYAAMQAAGIRGESVAIAERKYALDGKAWQYLFAWATPVLDGRPKTFHSAEIAFAFDNAGLCVAQTGGGPAALKLSGQVSGAWAAFAHHGDPNHEGLPHWPSYGANRPTMVFDDPCRVRSDPDGPGRSLVLQQT